MMSVNSSACYNVAPLQRTPWNGEKILVTLGCNVLVLVLGQRETCQGLNFELVMPTYSAVEVPFVLDTVVSSKTFHWFD